MLDPGIWVAAAAIYFALVIGSWSIEVALVTLGMHRGRLGDVVRRITGSLILMCGASIVALVFVTLARYFLGGMT